MCFVLIGSLYAYLLHIWSVITWVLSYSYPFSTFCNWITLIGNLRCAHANQLTEMVWFALAFSSLFET